MKKILSKKTGVTVLEGLIALGLLALVAAGTFGVLLSVSRKAGTPDIRESMILAVERVNEQLQMYPPVLYLSSDAEIPSELRNGLCGGDSNPLAVGRTHFINCMLPPICDRNTSSFYYTTGTEKVNMSVPFSAKYSSSGMVEGWGASPYASVMSVKYYITCNGFTL